MILIKEVILCQVVIAHWAIFEMTFIDTDGQAKNCKLKKNLKFQNNLTKKKKKSNSVSRLFEEGIKKCT